MARAGKKHSTPPTDVPLSKALRGLGRLTYILKKATAAQVLDESLTTDERLLLAWQHRVLDTAVRELIAKRALPREKRLYALWEVVGAVCIIAPVVLNDPIRNRLRAALATSKTRAKSVEIDAIIHEAVNATPPRKTWTPHWLAGQILTRVNEQSTVQGLPSLKRNAVRQRLEKQLAPWPRVHHRSMMQS